MKIRDYVYVGGIYLLNKMFLVFLVWLTRGVLHPYLPTEAGGYHHNILLDSFIRWDSGWFLRIAAQGYDFHHAPFFPMYPFLINIFGKITGDTVVAGLLIANIALLVACIFLYRIAKEEFNEKTARLTIFIMLFFPTAVFYTALYTESLFLAFALSSFYLARKQRWLPAILLACCATLTRNAGVVLFLAYCYMIYQQCGHKIIWQRLLPLCAIPASLSIFMLVLWQQAGDPLAFMHSLNTEFWSYRQFKYPGAGQFTLLKEFYYGSSFYNIFESFMGLSFLCIVLYSCKVIKDKPLLIFLVLSFILVFSSVVEGKPLGMPRYVLVLFPGFIALAHLLTTSRLTILYGAISIIFFATTTISFIIGRWIS
jgi:Gpi18-like mannosyltransferase